MANQYVCELCHPAAVEIAQFFPGLWLVLENEKYKLIGFDAHGGDILFEFLRKPHKEPVPVDEDNMTDAELESCIQWDCAVEEAEKNFKLDPYSGYELVTECIKHAGFDPKKDGRFFPWLWNRCVSLITS